MSRAFPAEFARQVPLRYRLAAYWQWLVVSIPLGLGVALTYFPMGMLVALTARPAVNHLHERSAIHSPQYRALGSSGFWEYWASPWRWLDAWNNYEDGTLGEPSGKHSARCGGKERTWLNQYLWICRNSFNKAKRTSSFFACFVNDCDIEWWGSRTLSDKDQPVPGWHFCRAVHRKTGRVYYGYRRVALNDDGSVYNAVFGFKIKPGHAGTVQDADDLDKAFTLRIQFASQPD